MKLRPDIAQAAVAAPASPPPGGPERATAKRELADSELRSALPQRGSERSSAPRSGTSVVMPAQGSRAVWVVRRAEDTQAREVEASIESSELDELIADWADDVIDRSMETDPDRDVGEQVLRSPVPVPHRHPRDPARADARAPSQDTPQAASEREHGEDEPEEQQKDERKRAGPSTAPEPGLDNEAQQGSAWDAMLPNPIATARHRYARTAVPAVVPIQRAHRESATRSDEEIAAPQASTASAAILWALAAMVVAIVITLLTAIFREPPSTPPDETDTAPRETHTDTRSL